jgi:hypothetical protein
MRKRESASFAASPKHVNANSYCGRHSKDTCLAGRGLGICGGPLPRSNNLPSLPACV